MHIVVEVAKTTGSRALQRPGICHRLIVVVESAVLDALWRFEPGPVMIASSLHIRYRRLDRTIIHSTFFARRPRSLEWSLSRLSHMVGVGFSVNRSPDSLRSFARTPRTPNANVVL